MFSKNQLAEGKYSRSINICVELKTITIISQFPFKSILSYVQGILKFNSFQTSSGIVQGSVTLRITIF